MDLKKRNCIVVIEQSSNTAVKCLKKEKIWGFNFFLTSLGKDLLGLINTRFTKIMPYCGCAATFFLHTLLTWWFHFENRGKHIIFSHSLIFSGNHLFFWYLFSLVRKCLNTFLHSAYFGQNNLLVLYGDKIKLGRKCHRHHFIYSELGLGT